MAKRTQHTIGLDIGTSKVTCIAGEPGEGGLLEVVGIGEAEARGLRKGVIVNPDRVRSQMEGAAVMAVGLARTGEITAKGGRINQSNFHDFQVARMSDAPFQVDVHFVDSEALPTGVGEPGLPPVLSALGNAIFAATGKRVRELPISKMKLV